MKRLSDYLERIFIFVVILASVILYIKATTILPVLADGTHHVWLTEFVWKNGYFPKTDITGTQPAQFNVPRSINNNEPMLYQPLFYLMSGALTAVTNNPTISIDIINILTTLGTNLIAFFLIRKMFGRQVAMLSYVLISFSSIWIWFIGQRLIEPTTIFLVFSSVSLIHSYMTTKRMKYLFFIVLCTASLLTIKFSNVFVVAIIMAFIVIYLLYEKKILIASLVVLLFALGITPLIIFSYQVNQSPLVIKTGVEKIDSLFPNAWWNLPLADWEVELNKTVYTKISGEKIYNQYYDSLNPPQKTLHRFGLLGIVNEFSLLPITDSFESFQTKTPFNKSSLALLLVLLSPFVYRYVKDKSSRLTLFLVTLIIISTLVFWYAQPQFRYYIYSLFLSVYIYAAALFFLQKSFVNAKAYLLFLPLCIMLILLANVASEFAFLKGLNNSAMYRIIHDKEGGLKVSMEFGEYLKNNSDKSKAVFTPMKEIAFYSRKTYLWDYRLFLVDNRNELLVYLSHYDFDYVVTPFYSGRVDIVNWRYYDGIPRDSTFFQLLRDPEYFQLVESNSTFTAYRRTKLWTTELLKPKLRFHLEPYTKQRS